MKYPITAFSFQHKSFSQLSLVTALGDWSRRKSRAAPPCMWGNSLAGLVVLLGKCALQIGVLFFLFFFFAWVTQPVLNYQIRLHKSELTVPQ
jgi:hypothetical protein